MVLQGLLCLLKIIGRLLLIVLVLLLGILAMVLLVPIRYHIKVSYETEPYGSLSLTWLFHFCKVQLQYEEGTKKKRITICGIPVQKKKNQIQQAKQTAQSPSDSETAECSETKTVTIQEAQTASSKKVREEHSAPKKRRSISETISRRKQQISRKWNDWNAWKCRMQRWIAWWRKEETREAYQYGKNQCMALWHSIKPKKGDAYIKYGTGSPDTTGYVTGLLSFLYAGTKGKFHATPNFIEPVFEGSMWIQGRIYIGAVLWIFAKLYFNKKIRNVYFEMKRI